MPIRNLDRILAPRSVAVVGASMRAGSVGQTVLHNLRAAGVLRLYPVNPKHERLSDLTCWPTVSKLPEIVDLAVICTPAATVPGLVRECGEAGIRGMVILTAGFGETGFAGRELEEAIKRETAPFPELRILGPNCLGLVAPHNGLNASFVDQLPPPGHVAFLSQSGALCSAILDWAAAENVGFSYFISLGNMLDVGVADLLDFLVDDPYTRSVVLYLESITEARRFMSAARAFSRNKPIIAYKAGRFAESAQAAASHTGALAGVDAVYEAAFARAGIVRVFESEDLFDCAELLARSRPIIGSRLAIVSNAGGHGVMATDSLIAHRGNLAHFSAETIATLNQHLPATWSHGNPVDIIGDAPPERFRAAVNAVLKDDGVDGLLVILSPQSMSDPTRSAQEVIAASASSTKPVLATWMGGKRVVAGSELLQAAGISNYHTPEEAIRAFSFLVTAAARQETLYETLREPHLTFELDPGALQKRVASIIGSDRGTLNELKSKRILAEYGIPVTQTYCASNPDEVVARGREIGFLIVLKLLSPEITHKSDVGGVESNMPNDAKAVSAYQRIIKRAKEKQPGARIDGVTVQPMVAFSHSHELILGVKRDSVFGAVLLVGTGGTAAEVWQDRALELPPLSEKLARRMLESLRSWPLLNGFRGKPAVQLNRLVEVLMRLSYLVAHHPEILELDINPLLATPEGALALDARIVLDSQALLQRPPQYGHLAILPNPESLW